MPRRKRSPRANRAALGPGSCIAAYLRESGGAGQIMSVRQQRAALTAYAAERGWQIVAWYVDDAKSGANDERRALQTLLASCRVDNPGFVAVLTWAASRFGRDMLDSQFNRIDLRRRGIDVVSADPAEATPDGSLGFVIEALFDWKNERFLDDMARDVRRGLRDNVTAGYAPGGTPPRGYVAEPVTIGMRRDGKPKVVSRWVVDPETAPKVTQAFRLFAAGASYAEIHSATRLYSSSGSYVTMIRNRSYLGVLKFGEEEFPNMIEPLVDQETWDACQARIAAGAHYTPRPGSEYLLSGLAQCGFCEAAMSGGVDRRNERRGYKAWRYYKCDRKRREGALSCPDQRHVGADLLEKRVISAVLERILTPENMTRLVEDMRARAGQQGVAADLADLDNQITAVERGIDRLYDLAQRAGSDERLEARLAHERAELAKLEAKRSKVRNLQLRFARALEPDELMAVLVALREGVASDEVSVARRALKGFVERVVVRGDEFRIDYRADVLLALGEVPPRDRLDCASTGVFSLLVGATVAPSEV